MENSGFDETEFGGEPENANETNQRENDVEKEIGQNGSQGSVLEDKGEIPAAYAGMPAEAEI